MLATAPAAALCGIWFVLDPVSTDMAAHQFRAEWFRQAGFSVWNFNWFAGHYTPSYSVFSPVLSAWLGVRILAVVAVLVAVAGFAVLVRRHKHAVLAITWFSCTAPVSAFTGRVPFALGFAVAIWTLVGASRLRQGKNWRSLGARSGERRLIGERSGKAFGAAPTRSTPRPGRPGIAPSPPGRCAGPPARSATPPPPRDTP